MFKALKREKAFMGLGKECIHESFVSLDKIKKIELYGDGVIKLYADDYRFPRLFSFNKRTIITIDEEDEA